MDRSPGYHPGINTNKVFPPGRGGWKTRSSTPPACVPLKTNSGGVAPSYAPINPLGFSFPVNSFPNAFPIRAGKLPHPEKRPRDFSL